MGMAAIDPQRKSTNVRFKTLQSKCRIDHVDDSVSRIPKSLSPGTTHGPSPSSFHLPASSFALISIARCCTKGHSSPDHAMKIPSGVDVSQCCGQSVAQCDVAEQSSPRRHATYIHANRSTVSANLEPCNAVCSSPIISSTAGFKLLTASRSKSTARRSGGAPLGIDIESPFGLDTNGTAVSSVS